MDIELSPELQDTLSRILLVILIVILTWFVRRIAPFFARRIIQFMWRGIRAFSGSDNTLNEQLTEAIIPPLRLLIAGIGLSLIFLIVDFPSFLGNIRSQLIATVIALGIFWGILRFVDVFAHYLETSNRFNLLDSTLVRFGNQLLKMIILIFGFVIIMREWGYDLAGLIAGLGIGGLAVALAAQDTLANLFGYLVIITDAPFKVGHLIEVDGVEGFIEDISLRSTRLRQRDRSLTIIPNRTIVDSTVKNWSRLTSRQVKMVVGVTYSTTDEQIVKIVEDIRAMIDEHKRVTKQRRTVEFVEFGASSLDILVICFVDTVLWEDLLAIKMDINLRIMRILTKHNVEIAFPTRSIVIESGSLPSENN